MNINQSVCPRKFKFFRVLLPGFTRKLSLPREFIKYFIQENSTWATLLSPLGKSWHVRVNGDGRTLRFEDGWKNFAEAHKLTMGDFLVFKHKGSLIFDVTIFDPTTCERDYTSGLTHGGTDDKTSQRKTQVAGGEEVDNNIGVGLKGSGKLEGSSCGERAAEPMETVTSSEHRSSETEDSNEQRREHQAPYIKKGATGGTRFEVVIRGCYHRYLEIPPRFRASNNLSSIHQLFLQDPKGNVWPTNVKHRPEGSRIRSRIYEGWQKFRVANGLEDGDICVFELKKRNVLRVKVHKRAGFQKHRREENLRSMKVPKVKCYQKRPKPNHSQATPEGMARDAKPLGSMDKCTPCLCFTSKILPRGLGKGILNIPRAFLQSVADFSTVRQIILVDSHSRQWHVNINHWKVNSLEFAQIGMGWRAFCACNNVEAGDACILKLTSRERGFVFHVEKTQYGSWRRLHLQCHNQRGGLCLPCRGNQPTHLCQPHVEVLLPFWSSSCHGDDRTNHLNPLITSRRAAACPLLLT